jgi:hypothetical protein
MRISWRVRLVLLAGLTFTLLTGGRLTAAAQKDEVKFQRVHIPTCDGMELGGTFYPNAGGKKEAVVLLLHNFDPRKGGGSHQDGWDGLAARLVKEGYAVLSFDFRGFGDSKSVGPMFWNYPHNKVLKGARAVRPPASIDQKDFPAPYYRFLVNDVAAARSFLDRKNDSREVNSSNLILIGAGEGATLGALWMAAECRRQKDKMSDQPIGLRPLIPQLDDPEGKDLAAAIWLSISPSVAGISVTTTLKTALTDVIIKGEVPTVFVYGKNDKKADDLTANYLKAITTDKGKTIELKKTTGSKAIPQTELVGSKLLGQKLPTVDFIVKHLNQVMEDRGSKEWKKRNEEKYAYFWVVPWPTAKKVRQIPAKAPGSKVSDPIPFGKLP